MGVTAWLRHSLAEGLDLDDPRLTVCRRRIIGEKPFLMAVYREWYESLARALPIAREPVLELGSGAGFMNQYVPRLITSDILPVAGLAVALDARALPFPTASMRGIVLTNVFHHVADVGALLREAARVVKVGGVMAMIEPWCTPWSRIVYRYLHHEPFDDTAAGWELAAGGGPLTSANSALPWLVFARDRARFARDFPAWRVDSITTMMPFRYLVSGGVSMRSLMPGWAFPAWTWLERGLRPLNRSLAMFARIVLTRVDTSVAAGPS
jgi:SAM-dependent methyltransferase